ncbi:SDR family NAD(P)-dependent oxidoreductase [Arthrobacter roseus]|uniref:SDR family NAD(P)-dependent oxidoreductase n=1 Tax=Arthrobacter roseus TaxID=136274 RepID=UPI00196516EE|nr:SDR family oxidoreductase [Arthrobacter roseus]MBM7847792.1 short-subunit dehydrogenase [Arthrobacter roseus]
MTETVLITGATAGLGAEFATQLAARGSNLVLVARTQERLEQSASDLRVRYGVTVEVLPADLHDDDGVARVVARLQDEVSPVTTLINNAGYGLRTAFAQSPIQDELNHLKIHVEVPLTLSHAALQGMLARKTGYIINVASVAGFTPRSTYGAVKAAMISFSRWANIAYGRKGVTVTALCPGFVHTEFHQRMKVDKATVPSWMWLNVEQVVSEALRDAAAGKAVSIPSVRYKVLAFVAQLLPASFVARIAAKGR